VILLQRHGQSVVRNKRDRPARRIASSLRLGSLAPGNLARKPLWFIKSKRRRVFDAGGASLEGSALHGVVFDRSARPQKRAGEARLPGSGREISLRS
jgi:hypothetical protein